MDFPPSLYKAVFDQILSNTVFSEACIDPKLNEEEEERLLKEQTELIWKRLCHRWAERQNWGFPTKSYAIHNSGYIHKLPDEIWDIKWWED